jgi:uncharacterized protein (DUF1800 family)
MPLYPYGAWEADYSYDPDDHDDGEKTFLGHTGNFNGQDIIDIICRHPATAKFVARHLYNFFVADEAQVPAWQTVPPRDPEAIQTLMDAFVENDYDIRAVLRVLFNSDFFKEARFSRIKSPVEVVVNTLRFVGNHEFPAPGIGNLGRQTGYMGQEVLNPPSVEGWHTGREWINSGSLMRRINFVADLVGDVTLPGVKAIVDRLRDAGELTTDEFVDVCLERMGPLDPDSQTRQELIDHASLDGNLAWKSESQAELSTLRVSEMLQLIASLRDFQYA